MTAATIYTLLIDAMETNLPPGWTIARLNITFVSGGSEAEFNGTYLDEAGEEQPLTTDFPDEVNEAVLELYANRKREALPLANQLQLDLAHTGKYATAYSWDQEVQDEEEHFGRGGTARDWKAIREAKYGPNTSES